MPVLVNPKSCLNRENCFAANACPYDAYIHNTLKKTWEVDATICGDCPGPCVNFCDQDAVLWGDDLVDLGFVRAGLEGKMKPEEVEEARAKHRKERAEAQKKNKDVVELTRANFEQEVLRSPIPVVVDCWADWCAPCKQFSPIFEATAKQYEGVVKFTKLDTDAEPALARGLGVEALPTVLFLYKGQLVNVVEGALPAQQFQTWIYQTLAVVRQYEAQLEAEAAGAIDAGTGNVSSLDGRASDELSTSPADLLDPLSSAFPPPPETDGPGKKTSSGIYIP
jgi:thioredoxin